MIFKIVLMTFVVTILSRIVVAVYKVGREDQVLHDQGAFDIPKSGDVTANYVLVRMFYELFAWLVHIITRLFEEAEALRKDFAID